MLSILLGIIKIMVFFILAIFIYTVFRTILLLKRSNVKKDKFKQNRQTKSSAKIIELDNDQYKVE